MTRLRLLAAIVLALLAAAPARAWWEYGHETIATIAMHEATPRTRAAVRRLLAQSALLQTPTCPARTIEQASVWADCVKTLGDRYSYAYDWHYQNIDVCRPFAVKLNCPDGNCVSSQIGRMARMLKDRSLPARVRVEALAFLVHFVGDLHQPLHAGDRGDRGGNDVKARYGAIPHSNLHAVWDGLLADRAISTPPGGALGILSQVAPAERAALAAGSVEDWSRDSWQVAHDAVYATVLGGDACAAKPGDSITVDAAQVDALIPVLRRQIAKGGLRLARLLDEALG